jgi:hypothetical protein
MRGFLGYDKILARVDENTIHLEALCRSLGIRRDEVEHTVAVIRSQSDELEEQEGPSLGCHPAAANW